MITDKRLALVRGAEADGYAFLGTWSVSLPGNIAMVILDEDGKRPEYAEEIAQVVADAIRLYVAQHTPANGPAAGYASALRGHV